MDNPFNEKYQCDGFYYGTEPNEFLRENYHYLPAKGKILSLAEGEGRNAVFLATKGFEVTGVDASPYGLEKLKSLAASHSVKVHTVCTDLAEYEFETAAWDGIVLIFCHLPPPLRTIVYQRCVEALKPNGVLILEAYRPEQVAFQTGGPPAELALTKEILEHDFGSLRWEMCESKEREVVEGRGHTGMGAVIQLIGVKPPPIE